MHRSALFCYAKTALEQVRKILKIQADASFFPDSGNVYNSILEKVLDASFQLSGAVLLGV